HAGKIPPFQSLRDRVERGLGMNGFQQLPGLLISYFHTILHGPKSVGKVQKLTADRSKELLFFFGKFKDRNGRIFSKRTIGIFGQGPVLMKYIMQGSAL